ncbi:hypothetical protein PENSPDRAFT_670440 [Peniophora sp. CONT]|nr:hypothetical protein PENSPDRAFT_670440 [Peniophora sp. CONT]
MPDVGGVMRLDGLRRSLFSFSSLLDDLLLRFLHRVLILAELLDFGVTLLVNPIFSLGRLRVNAIMGKRRTHLLNLLRHDELVLIEVREDVDTTTNKRQVDNLGLDSEGFIGGWLPDGRSDRSELNYPNTESYKK